MGATIVEITLAEPAAAARARGVLAPIGRMEADGDGRTLGVNVSSGRGVLDVARVLADADLVPEAFTVREPTLDDVFLELTGHRTTALTEPSGPRRQEGAA
jgi:ABC-2 type transport system ATP-binding protein